MSVPASLVYTGFTVMDAFIFLNPKRTVDENLRTVARPILTFVFRRVIYFFFSKGVGMSTGSDVKLYGLLTMHVVLQLANVRLATSCTSVADVLTVLAFDWVATAGMDATFHHSSQRALTQPQVDLSPCTHPTPTVLSQGFWLGRSVVFYMATAPKAIKMKYPSFVRTLLYIQTFDKINPKGTTFRRFSPLTSKTRPDGMPEAGTIATVQLHDFRRFEYLLENAALTMCCESAMAPISRAHSMACS